MVAGAPSQKAVVLIPTLNEADHIAQVLTQLLTEDPIAQGALVVVADGGSTDGTQGIVTDMKAQFPNVELVDNAQRTQSYAMNLLLDGRFDSYEIAIRCDAHANYPSHFISDLVKGLDAHPEVASVVIPMDAVPSGNCFRRGLAYVADSKLGAGGSPHRGGVTSGYVDHGHHAAFRLDVFRELGGYDTDFVANEDAEYDRRVIRSGRKIWLEAAIRIGYYPRDTLTGLWRQYYKYGVGRARNCIKHNERPALRQMIPVIHVVLFAVSLLVLPFSNAGWLWPIIYGSILTVVALHMAWNKKTRCGLIAFPALGAMHTAWGLGFLRGVMKGI